MAGGAWNLVVAAITRALPVAELALDVLALLLGEKLHVGGLCGILEPGMTQDLGDVQSLCWVLFEKAFEEVPGLLGDVLFEAVLGLHDDFLQLGHIVGLEGHSTVEHGVEDYASRPDVDFEAKVALVAQDLWSNVGGSSALLGHFLTLFDYFPDSKVADLHLTVRIEQDVVKLNISV